MAVPSSEVIRREERTVYVPQLDVPKIELLARVLAAGITSDPVCFQTDWNGSLLQASSLQELRQKVYDCLDSADPPQRLDTLELSAAGPGGWIRLVIDKQVATVIVEAQKAIAYGKANQIEKILRDTGGRSDLWLPGWRAPHFSLAGMMISLVVGAAFIVGLGIGLLSIGLAAGFIVATTVTGYLIGRRWSARNQTVIWVDGPLPKRGWAGWSRRDKIASLSLVASSLVVVVMLLSMIITLL